MEAKERKKITKNFYIDEFACKCGCGSESIDFTLVRMLQSVREKFGQSMRITSGVRCPSHNEKIGGVKQSTHLLGIACDIHCSNSSLRYQLLPLLFEKFKRIGVYSDFFHVDIDQSKAQGVCWG